MNDYDELLATMKELAAGLQALSQQATQQLAPIVEDILRSRNRDQRLIERTLDKLLDVCGYEPALLLYRRLCRHYWDIDPGATVGYINAYREMWDSEEETASNIVSGTALAAGVFNSASEEPAASAVPLRETRP